MGDQIPAVAASGRNGSSGRRPGADRQPTSASLPLLPGASLPRLSGIASFGYDALVHQTYYGLRLHLCITWPSVITAATLAPPMRLTLPLRPEFLAGQRGGLLETALTEARVCGRIWRCGSLSCWRHSVARW